MGTAAVSGEVTLTPIFWIPPGYEGGMPTSYQDLIAAFDVNLAADSGSSTNALSVLSGYTGGSPKRHLAYLVHAGTPIVDTEALPADGCAVDAGPVYNDDASYSACVNDLQISEEITRVVTAESLPLDRSHLYAIFTPKGLEVCFDDAGTSCTPNNDVSADGFCAYHSSTTTESLPVIYSVEPYPVWDSATGYACNGDNQFPLGNPAADIAISTYSHEVAEAITDPFGTAWIDSVGNEIGDLCNFDYGPLIDSTPGSAYSQVINGVGYYLQTEFSNASFSLDHSKGCVSAWTTPTARYSIRGDRRSGAAISFSSTSITGSGRIRSFEWQVNGRVRSTEAAYVRAFRVPGTRTVTLTITDAGGYQSTTTKQVIITG